MTALDVISPMYYSFSFLPLIIISISFIGIGVLLGIGFLIGQRGALSIGRRLKPNVRISRTITLTLASILLLSGLWCMFISPASSYYENRENFYMEISIEGQNSWSYNLKMYEGDTLDGSINELWTYERYNVSSITFNFRIYDQNNNIVWSRNRVSNANFNLKPVKPVDYKIEVQNPNNQIMDYSIRFTIRGKVTNRPLNPLGQWLSIISLPVFGFGIWTWVSLKTKKKD